MSQKGRLFFIVILFLAANTFCFNSLQAQIRSKEINHQLQTWVSINSTYRFNKHWGAMADFHIRRNNFIADPNFYFLRFGANYWIRDNMTAALGYAHMWLLPSSNGGTTWSNENRIFQQFLYSTNYGKTGITQRLRNEQRWQEQIINEKTGEIIFTNRVRYLASFTIKIFEKPTLPALIIADEILFHFGKEVVYNTFDQNRLFLGIRQNINPKLSFDFGYMNVYQQKYSGFQYDMNHTIRLFFYYNSGWKKGIKNPVSEHHDE
jgi:Protein of unknown function (DUF2490)